ncbi:MAG: class II fumarate hydratase [Planctomycetes bacterium]|nr:class II fumarate hydratase [Planctomycetota bacterium]MCG2684770.1 class II fumarate hydratase [Planctomycetales bacterium]
MAKYRTERDSMGEVRLPADAYFGPQTQRAVKNFPISGRTLPPELIHALGLVKWAAAGVNRDLGRFGEGEKGTAPICRNGPQGAAHKWGLSPFLLDALLAACREVADGKLDDHFPVDVFQTGSGTSSNMNANEVIANRAIELSEVRGQRSEVRNQKSEIRPIHPNDHVNLGQSSNDVFPTAIHLAAARAIRERLIPALQRCAKMLSRKAAEWQDVLKIGRTHLTDATPITLGQEIGGMARQMDRSAGRAAAAIDALLELPIGGTAVGTGVNTHPEFGRRVCELLARETGIPFVEAADHFEANSQRDGLVECHGQLRTVAVALFAVANNIRWLASGPQCGFSEIKLPERQPGSSIMPGKVNPVLCESAMQAAARVLGNDQTVAFCGAAGGQFQLNVMMPVMADAVLESVRLLANAASAFTDFCLSRLEANVEACEAAVEKSLSMATALTPLIGYEQAAALAKEAFASGKTIRQLCREKNVLPEEQLDEALDPRRMTRP